MLRWEWVAIGYFTYLAAVATFVPRFARARVAAIAAATAAWALLAPASAWSPGLADVTLALLPVPVLLAGYWLSGCFFHGPMRRLERWLLRIDDLCLRARWAYGRKTWLARYFELAYLLVYAVVPAGALTLVFADRADAVGRFWGVVILAAFASYGALPWVQTRPPRVVEDLNGLAGRDESAWLRRLNLWVLGRTSIQVNTVPSGHAATATAVALAVSAAIPEARAIVVIISASIVVSTVVGRYHYVLDSVAGVLVGVIAWILVLALE
jgi:membrane-associated phospholipid phosphatase